MLYRIGTNRGAAMLNVFDGAGPSRRAFLRIGALGLGGLSLSHLLAARAAAAESKAPVTDKSVVFLFMHGGPSQFETFDPKMSAPDGTRSVTGETKTALPGVTFGPTFAKLARLADRMAVVRSYVPGDANHDAKPVVHRDTLGASLGSFYARVAGMNHPLTGLPSNVTLFPQAVDAASQPPVQGLGNFLATGPLGAAYAPFVPGGGSNLQQDMRLKVPRDRLDDRRLLRAEFDNLKRQLDTGGAYDALDRFEAQALDVLLRGVADAFDLSKENARVLARYDTAPLVPPDSINKKWNNHKYYTDHSRTLGKLMLLARRLVEAGCGFVTVNTNFVWDMHADVNNATCEEGMRYVGLPFDHAVSAFIEDIEARGLSDRVLLVCCGEMGRTPRVNKAGGRDHWGNLGPLFFSGGGLRMGQVIGQSTANGGDPASDPVRIPNVIATIMNTLLDLGQVRILRGLSGDVARVLTQGEPIPQLVP
jgi:uncharacterized protein (DUF1501 family)